MNSIFSRNAAVQGGVIRTLMANLSIDSTVFNLNTAYVAGVILASENSEVNISNSILKANVASSKAGVVSITSDSIVNIENCLVEDNQSHQDGSILDALGSSTKKNITLRNSIFKNNYA